MLISYIVVLADFSRFSRVVGLVVLYIILEANKTTIVIKVIGLLY